LPSERLEQGPALGAVEVQHQTLGTLLSEERLVGRAAVGGDTQRERPVDVLAMDFEDARGERPVRLDGLGRRAGVDGGDGYCRGDRISSIGLGRIGGRSRRLGHSQRGIEPSLRCGRGRG
jgi:hypothetical protein